MQPQETMASVAVLPAVALLAGIVCAVASPVPAAIGFAVPVLCGAAWLTWGHRRPRSTVALGLTACVVVGGALGADARTRALDPSLRQVLDAAVGGFAVGSAPSPGPDPVPTRLVLLEDAATAPGGTTLRAAVSAVEVDGDWVSARGTAIVGVRGQAAVDAVTAWTAGRTLELPVTWRRPTRYLNDGLGDAERAMALDGIALLGSVKSGLLVRVPGRGTPWREAAGRVRAHIRQRVARWVSSHGEVSGGVVTAILIGDRTGLPDDVRERLQRAGTYHVIAISGGNIAILVGLVLFGASAVGLGGRAAAATTLAVLGLYVAVVTAEPSVWRATLMAGLYLGARLVDLRVKPWQGVAVAAALAACAQPLDVRAVGFVLTFGATIALLAVARLMSPTVAWPGPLRWVAACVLASVAVEVLLLPVFVSAFGRVTAAGVMLNLLAVPLMTVVQVAGLAVALAPGPDWALQAAGWTGHAASAGILETARLVDLLPWLVHQAPPPSLALVLVYYAALAVAWSGRGRARVAATAACGVSAALIVTGVALWPRGADAPDRLRLTMFDVGQGEAVLLEAPSGPRVLVDAGGLPFGDGIDIGERVLVPALWARGLRRLDIFLMTHADPDHLGGGAAVLRAFRPSAVWEGVPVAEHPGRRVFVEVARDLGASIDVRTRGETIPLGRASLRVLHPPPPDWQRPDVRNDDSVVVEVVYGEVAILLTGDISAEIERALVPRLTPARHRVLKVAHHGSRTSTGRALVEGWQPHVALISAGRGNSFGHPVPEVVARLEGAGAEIYRTDLDGQITLETDGTTVQVSTFAPR